MSLRFCARRILFLRCRLQKHQLKCVRVLPHCNSSNVTYSANASISTHRILKLPTKDENESKVELDNYILASNETLETLADYFEELLERCNSLTNADVEYADGVLTVKFGEPHGTYVINRQVPNLQIWLSSPTSGPKRYDLVEGHWVYHRDGVSLHTLLDEEISKIVKTEVNFQKLPYSTPQK